MTRVWIAARSAIVRAGLEALVRGDPHLEPADALEEADVLVEVTEDEAAPALHEPPLVLISESAGGEFTAGALRGGVRAVLPPDAPEAEIRAAIHAAAAGLTVLRPGDLETVLTPAAPDGSADHTLSPRELEILRMLAEGLANKAIAWKLGISEHTVKFHVASILHRLSAASRTEAVTIGIRRGLIML